MIEKDINYNFNMISPKKVMYATYKASNNFQYRSLFKAKSDILKSGKYDEKELNDIIASIFDAETARKYIFEELKGKKPLMLEEIIKLFDFPTENIIRDIFYLKEQGYIEEIFEEVQNNKLNYGESSEFEKGVYKYRVKEHTENFRENCFEPVSIVYNNSVCCHCGLCSSICPMNGIELTRDYLYIDEGKCINCGLCYSVCPQSFSIENLSHFIKKSDPSLKYSVGLGYYKNLYSARTMKYAIRKVGQDGGIGTSLLYYLLNKKLVDAVVTIKHSKDYWKPKAKVIDKVEDLYRTAGTTYVHTPILSVLDKTERYNKIAIVALPCKIKALSKGELFPVKLPLFNKIKYKIGLFCMESFPYEKLLKLISNKFSADPDEIIKMDINRGKFVITLASMEIFSLPLKECNLFTSDFCNYCNDYTAEIADISLGSIGSESGWTSVITRTKKGEEIFNGANKDGLIEIKSYPDKKPLQSKIEKVAELKKVSCKPIDLHVI